MRSLRGGFVQIGHARLDRVGEAFQAQVGLGRPFGKVSRVGALAGTARLSVEATAIEGRTKDSVETAADRRDRDWRHFPL
jgi:hypothetical protein